MSNQTPQVDKWILSPPGGPSGPFWRIVTQSGDVLAGDYDTTRDVAEKVKNFTYAPNSNDYIGVKITVPLAEYRQELVRQLEARRASERTEYLRLKAKYEEKYGWRK